MVNKPRLLIRRANGPGRVRSRATKYIQAIFIQATFKRHSRGLLIAIQDGGWGPWIEEMGSPRVAQSPPKAPPEKFPELATTFENIGFS